MISAVIEQIEPTVKAANSILADYDKARADKKIAEDSYDAMKKRVEPYLAVIKGLNQEEITRVNEVMQLESRRISIEGDRYRKAM